MSDDDIEYKAESADGLVGEIFRGQLPIAEALQRLRTRLLDLSSRNRLLSYRHPKRRCVQFVDNPDLNLLFERLLDGKSVLIKPVPEPDPFSYETGKKPEARQYAERLRLGIEYEFPEPKSANAWHRRTPTLQTLFYPAELDKFLRKISYEARTVIEETGTNMLYIMFGVLEFYDSDESERPFVSPLLAVPASLTRGDIDPETRAYRYTLAYSGEDIAENHTLREKLKQDFRLNLPDFDQEQTPEEYFAKIQHAVRTKQRWKVRRQLTVGFLSFGKLAIWVDLDQKKWPDLLKHPLLKRVFEGGGSSSSSDSSSADGFHAEDYNIDAHKQADLPLIYDADSSQHSAIIDVLDGKDLVINGPPGTGKSQTITNVIAAVLSQGKKVLFVSEKLAALEVVRHRLERANLGHFCLEVHSNKTQKRKLLEDIGARLEERYRPQPQVREQLTVLVEHKKRLNRYAELMASCIGNEVGLTVHNVFWAAERRRRELGEVAGHLTSVVIRDANNWDLEKIERSRGKLESLGLLYQEIGGYDSSRPWWGFRPRLLSPGDDVTLGTIIADLVVQADEVAKLADQYEQFVDEGSSRSLQCFEELARLIEELPEPPERLGAELLPKLFSEGDLLGTHSRKVLARLSRDISQARELLEKARSVLKEGSNIELAHVDPVLRNAEGILARSALDAPIGELKGAADSVAATLERFNRARGAVSAPYNVIRTDNLARLRARLAKLSDHQVRYVALRDIDAAAKAVLAHHEQLSNAVERLTNIVTRFRLPFDPTPNSVAEVGKGDPVAGILPGVHVDDLVAAEAARRSHAAFCNLSLEAGREKVAYLQQFLDSYRAALEEIAGTASRVGLEFDPTTAGLAQFGALVRIASDAPHELLEHRHEKFGHPRLIEVAIKAEHAILTERGMRTRLEQDLHLDALPSVDQLKVHVRAFRRGDGFFNFFYAEWRAAKRQFHGIAREKRRLKAVDCEQMLSAVVVWLEHRTGFVTNQDFQDWFGTLFEGFETDFAKIRRLHAWYEASRAELLSHPGLVERVDLHQINRHLLAQLAARSENLQSALVTLMSADASLQHALGPEAAALLKAKSRSWPEALQALEALIAEMNERLEFFSRFLNDDVSPARGAELLQARLELKEITPDIQVLLAGCSSIAEAGGSVLSGLRDMRCENWPEYLVAVRAVCVNAEVLVESTKKYVTLAATPDATERLMETKLELDSAWAVIANASRANDIASWEDHTARAQAAVAAARNLHLVLVFHVLEGASSRGAVEAISARDEARHILASAASDSEIQELAGSVFSGEGTDLVALADTHTWGSLAATSFTLRHASFRRVLLSPRARENLGRSRTLLKDIARAIDRLRDSFKALETYGSFDWDAWHLPARTLAYEDFPGDVKARLELALENSSAVLSWSKYFSAKNECVEAELKDLVAGLEARKIPPARLALAFEFVFYQSIGRGIYKKYPELAHFSGTSHEKLREEFVALDSKIIQLNGLQFGYLIDKNKQLLDGETGVRAGDFTELALLRRELNKQRRHIPIRQLIKRAGRTLQELKPCFMMGPLSVAQYLEPGSVEFDLVVMDEASQLRVEESLGAIARGKQLVVVGDPKQLPPTSFFDRLTDGDEDDESDETSTALSGMESILDVCQQLFHPVRTLRWHYRSHHESLIAFSNHHFYKNLIVFPSPYAKSSHLGVRLRFIRNGIYKDRHNLPEAQRVVDAVIEHMLKRHDESLGVVTLNLTQRELIEDLLDKKLRSFEEGERFLSNHEKKGWPFFVKNLENVQGDERDVIFISTTFGRAPGTDKPRQNFGPISRPDGWRRLNVLFTRARLRVELFTSMRAEDIVVDDKTPQGTKALRDYLDYARRGVLATTDETDREPDSDFEIAVADVIRSRNFEVKPQLGVAGFFIDLAVRNPDRPGEFLAGIECDGATYHSSVSARDRDRIRQDILESLGWRGRIYRIWSTDWFYDPRNETNKLIDFLERRRATAITDPVLEYEEEFIDEKSRLPDEGSLQARGESAEVAITDAEDLFVEVGNRVSYCFAENPTEKHTVLIVDSESNPKLNILNENTPLALALLGLSQGETAQLEVPGRPARALRVLKIHRNDDEAA